MAQRVVTESPHGEGVAENCVDCHTVDAWIPLRSRLNFNHDTDTRFELTGKHTRTNCSSCHVALRFDLPGQMAEDCSTCHVDVHQNQFSRTCSTCHNTESFNLVDADLIHARSSFPLTGSHAQVSCQQCHMDDRDGAFTPLGSDCMACHATEYAEAEPVDHLALGYPETCLLCHTTLAWADGFFDHVKVAEGFELVGAHQLIQCAACHSESDFEVPFEAESANECYTCHEPDYNQEHAGTGFPTNCLTCHNTLSWTGTTFDHAVYSEGFALVGAHETASCESCHRGPSFEVPFTPTNQNDCISCHAQDYEDQHAGTGFPQTCLTCHNSVTWDDTSFEHAALSNGFALVGAHEALDCASCHAEPGFDVPFSPVDQNDCISCHSTDYEDEHSGSGFPETCLACHNVHAWEDATFNHAALSNGFALVGAHEALACESCHAGPDFSVPTHPSSQNDCISCHSTDYDDEHEGSGIPTNCLTCHNTSSWEDALFNHTIVSNGFGLIGAHEALSCESCHTGSDFTVPFDASDQNDCIACHAQDYETEHAGTGFPEACVTCHNTDTWTGATFDHLTTSGGFALIGSHQALNCESCHAGPGFEVPFTPIDQNDCISCHSTDYEAEHSGSGFPETCQTCHNTDAWTGATFDHVAISNGFALLGAHESLNCESCHLSSSFDPIFFPQDQNDCYSCHARDYEDEHSGTSFPTNCITCHNVNAWSETSFDHSSVSGGFALVGAHAPLACESCHAGPGFSVPAQPSSQNDCIACHASDYNQEHAGTNFPTSCLTCHNTTRWAGATFNHSTVSGGFQLVGAHTQISCESCHSGSNFSVPAQPSNQNDCYACHASDYNQEHSGSGFPTTCFSCHNTNTWDDASGFNHDAQYFPIYSGNHRDTWNDCQTCHTSAPATFTVFTCLNCHAHRQSEMDSEHRGIGGYVYESNACLSCHPNGDD